MAIIYSGDNSMGFSSTLKEPLSESWHKKVDGICEFVISNDEICSAIDGTERSFFEYSQNMFTKSSCFANMLGLTAFFVHDMKDYDSLDDFKSGYSKWIDLKNDDSVHHLSCVSIILLDETIEKRELSNNVRKWFNQLLEHEDSLLNPYTIIISNKLKNGLLIAESNAKDNYTLIGKLMILLNCSTPSYTTSIDSLFSLRPRRILTVSYSAVDRQNDQISSILIKEAFSWLAKKTEMGRKINQADICNDLGISGGQFPPIDNFTKNILPKFTPDINTLNYLPRNRYKENDNILSLTFAEFDAITMGSFEKFYSENYLTAFDSSNDDLIVNFKKYFSKYIREHISPLDASKSLTKGNVEAILSTVTFANPKTSFPVGKYVSERLLCDFWEQIKTICSDILLSYQTASAEQSVISRRICNLVMNENYSAPDDNMNMYYSNIINKHLDGQKGSDLLKKINPLSLSEDEIVDCVFDTIYDIVREEPIFSMPFGKALIQQLGQIGDVINNIIATKLTNPLNDNIRLSSAIALTAGKSFVMANQYDTGGKETDMWKGLTSFFNSHGDTVMLNSGDDNSISIIQFYQCSAAALL